MKIISAISKDKLFNYSKFKTFTIPPEEYINLDGYYNYIIDGKSLDSRNPCNIFSTQSNFCQNSPCFSSVLVLSLRFPDKYGHCLNDVLPSIIYHDLHSSADHIFCPKSFVLDSLIELFDVKFTKTKFIDQPDTFSVNTSKICIYQLTKPKAHRHESKIILFKGLINKKFETEDSREKPSRLIYCTRNTSSDVRGKRLMNDQNEKDIFQLLENFSKKRRLIFTIFNGQENGQTMSHKKQAQLFREASVVVGPHGSAMANVIYLDENRKPKVCEFCSGTEVQIHGGVFNKHYNGLYAYTFDDLYDYYLIPFEKSSTKLETTIDIENLKNFLNSI